jgi:uncharacterized protein DUF6166
MKIEAKWNDDEGVDDYGYVCVDGRVLDPAVSLKVRNHSPDGFAWGYGGSGPAQLALAILLAAGAAQNVAEAHYQDFKDAFVSRWPKEGFSVEMDVLGWLDQNVERRRALMAARAL